jgi:hypothetical protein
MRIDERAPCPRCGYTRVVQRSADSFICFQCRNSWSIGPVVAEPLAWCSLEQRMRLETYRGAIRAGLYTDWPAA